MMQKQNQERIKNVYIAEHVRAKIPEYYTPGHTMTHVRAIPHQVIKKPGDQPRMPARQGRATPDRDRA